MAAAAPYTLVHRLRISSTCLEPINGPDLRRLLGCLPALQRVELSVVRLPEGLGSALVQHCPHLECLCLRLISPAGRYLSPSEFSAALQDLACAPKLCSLECYLHDPETTERRHTWRYLEAAATISSLRSLTWDWACWSQPVPAGALAPLASLTSLTRLSLPTLKVTPSSDATMAELASLVGLQELHLPSVTLHPTSTSWRTTLARMPSLRSATFGSVSVTQSLALGAADVLMQALQLHQAAPAALQGLLQGPLHMPLHGLFQGPLHGPLHLPPLHLHQPAAAPPPPPPLQQRLRHVAVESALAPEALLPLLRVLPGLHGICCIVAPTLEPVQQQVPIMLPLVGGDDDDADSDGEEGQMRPMHVRRSLLRLSDLQLLERELQRCAAAGATGAADEQGGVHASLRLSFGHCHGHEDLARQLHAAAAAFSGTLDSGAGGKPPLLGRPSLELCHITGLDRRELDEAMCTLLETAVTYAERVVLTDVDVDGLRGHWVEALVRPVGRRVVRFQACPGLSVDALQGLTTWLVQLERLGAVLEVAACPGMDAAGAGRRLWALSGAHVGVEVRVTDHLKPPPR